MNTRSLRFSKSATIACANSVRIPIAVHPSIVRAGQVVESLPVLSIAHRQVVGIHRVVHVPDAVAVDGVGDDRNGNATSVESARAFIPRAQERSEIVAVDGNSVKTKGPQLGVERFEGHHLLGTANSL